MAFYEDMQDVFVELVEEFGKEVTISREVETGGYNEAGNPSSGKATQTESFQTKGIVGDYDEFMMRMEGIEIGDKKFYVALKNATFVPEIGAIINDEKGKWVIVSTEKFEVQGYDIGIKAHIRGL